MALAAQPSFEVASIKTAAGRGEAPYFMLEPGVLERVTVVGSRVDIRFISLDRLIVRAYGIKPYQLSAPEGLKSAKFDIAARMPDGASRNQLGEMLQALLRDRFKLSIHRATRDLLVYALTIGKDGPKLQPSRTAPNSSPADGGHAIFTANGDGRSLETGGFVVNDGKFGPVKATAPGQGPHGGMRIEYLNLTIPALVDLLTPHLNYPVVDRTNLQGGYFFATETRAPGEGSGRKQDAPADDASSAAPRDAVGEALLRAAAQAGMKLEKSRAPVETIVVDHVEKTPVAN